MYSPSAFTISDPAAIRDFVRQHSFGIVLSRAGTTWHDTHTPLLISDDLGSLTGHLARANPQWRSWAEDPKVKVIFHGPHAYVSPRYYQSDFNVPTWNYTAVSVDGRIRILEDHDECLAIIQNLVLAHEGPEGWRMNVGDERYLKLLQAVVCFTIEIEGIEAKFKLNQNKSEDDRHSVISHLLASAHAGDRETAELMRGEDQRR